MFTKSLAGLCIVGGISGVFCVTFALRAQLPGQAAKKPDDKPQAAITEPVESDQRVPPGRRERAGRVDARHFCGHLGRDTRALFPR